MSTSSTLELLSQLRSLNVKLTADRDRVLFAAPVGALTPELQRELVARKAEILAFLRSAAAVARGPMKTIEPLPRSAEPTISFAQKRLWLLDQLEPGNAAYNIPAVFQLSGNLDQSILEQSFGEIVRRHEVLRTYYVNTDGTAKPMIAPAEPFELTVVNLQPLPELDRLKEAKRLETLYALRPFDLGTAPLIRATLLKLGPTKHSLLLDIHHIAFDGWSFGVLLRELSSLYKAFLNGEPSPLPEPAIQYSDFAAWQRQWLTGEVLLEQLDFWKKVLGGRLPILELPTDHLRPAVPTHSGGNVSFAFSKDLTDGLKELSRQEGATLFVTLLAAFQTLLMRYTSQEDILVGTPIATRNRLETEELIGFFVNTLVFRADLSGNPTFRGLLRQVRAMALDAQAHQDLPFEKLVEELNPERDPSRSPIFQVMFGFQNEPQQSLQLPGLEPSHLEFRAGAVKFDLSLFVQEREQRLTGVWSFNSDLFDVSTIERWSSHYQTLLEGIVKNPDEKLSKLPLLTDAECAQLLIERNLTEVVYPKDRCLHELFEEQVVRTPEALAAVFEDTHRTYRQLNEDANRLARHLQRLGVGPETLVGVFMERSLDMIVGLLAILKAGGAYVPMDPSYPKERIRSILEDSQALLVLTQTSLVSDLPDFMGKSICLDSDRGQIRTQSDENLASSAKSENLAYVLFTSGSTGRPKGVALEHRSAASFIQWANQTFSPKQLQGVLF